MVGPTYVNKDGKIVSGTAAQLHTISGNGGWDNHHRKFAMELLDELMPKMNTLKAPEQRKQKKDNILNLLRARSS